MIDVDKAGVTLTLQYGEFLDGLAKASEFLDDFEARLNAQSSKLALPSPSIELGSGGRGGFNAPDISGEMGSQADAIRESFVGVGASIRATFEGSLAPLNAFAADFSRKFDQVGATVQLLSIRIDNAMRAPLLKKRADAIRRAIEGAFLIPAREIPKDVAAAIEKAVGIEADASLLVGSFEALRQRIKQAVAPIPGDVGYAIEQATHVPAGGFQQLIKSVEDQTSAAIDRLKAAADAAQGRARGKGSVNRRRAGKAQADQIAAAHDATGPSVRTTDASPMVRQVKTLNEELKAVADWWDQIRGRVKGTVAPTTELGRGIARLRDSGAKAFEGLAAGPRIIGANLSRLYDLTNAAGKARGFFQSLGSVANATFGKLGRLKMPSFIDPRQSSLLRGVGASARSATSGIKALGVAAAAAAGIYSAATSTVSFFASGIKGASALNETLSKTDAVLGSASDGVKAFGDEMASKFGIAKQETLDVASGFGGILKGIGGLEGDQLGSVSTQLTTLAADVSSFANMGFSEAGEALRTVLSGNESDKLKALGVVTDEASVKAYAYAHGIAKVGSELTNQQKVQARVGTIMEQTRDIQGDLEKTSDSAANQYRKLTGNIENLATTVGTALLPAWQAALGAGNKVIEWASSGLTAALGAGGSLIDRFARTFQDSFDFISVAIAQPGAAFETLRLVGLQALTNIGEYLDTIPGNFRIITEYIGRNWHELIRDLIAGVGAFASNLFANLQAIGTAFGEWVANPTGGFKVNWTPLLDGFVQTAEKLPGLIKPALTDMSAQINAAARPIWDGVEAKRADAIRRADEAARRAAAKLNADARRDSPESELQKFAKKLSEKVRTPLEEYQDQVNKITKAFDAKLITGEVKARGIGEAEQKLYGDGPKFAAASDINSDDGRSAVLKAISGRGYSDMTDNTKRIAANGVGTNSRLDRLIAIQDRRPEPELGFN